MLDTSRLRHADLAERALRLVRRPAVLSARSPIHGLAGRWAPARRPPVMAAGPVVAWVLVLVLVGAAAVYLLDPVRGPVRRAVLRDRLRDWWRQGRSAGEAAMRRTRAAGEAVTRLRPAAP
jgi:hypothetical protein